MKALSGFSDLNVLEVDSSGNTALHRAAWYGELEISNAIIAKAKEKNQLTELLHARNTNKVGATVGETVLDNIRRGALSSDDQMALQCSMESPIPSHLEAQRYDPAFLNHHIPQTFWNTPLMQLLVDLNNEQDAKKKVQCREKITKLLDEHGSKIDFTASNFHGDTLLHYANWFGEFELGIKIIQQATINGQIKDVVAARNTQALTKIVGAFGLTQHAGGEVPHLNLAAAGKKAYKEFSQRFNSVVAPIIMLQSFISPDLVNTVSEADGLHTVLKRLMGLLDLAINSSTNGDVDVLIRRRESVEQVLNQYQQLKHWHRLCSLTLEQLSGEQKAELNHLLQVHGKELDGYNSMNFLQASPAHALNKLIQSTQAKSELGTADVKLLLEKLTQLQVSCTPESIADVLTFVNSKLSEMKAKSTPLLGMFTSNPTQELFVSARNCLVQYNDYMSGQLSTLKSQIADATVDFVPASELVEDFAAFTF